MNTPDARKTAQPRRLTPQQERFAGEYLIDLNATAAAQRAGYSRKACESLGYQLLRNPLVRAEIDQRKELRNEAVKITSEALLKRLLDDINADLADLFDESGGLKAVSEWPRPVGVPAS